MLPLKVINSVCLLNAADIKASFYCALYHFLPEIPLLFSDYYMLDLHSSPLLYIKKFSAKNYENVDYFAWRDCYIACASRQCLSVRKKCAEMGDYGGFDRASSDLAPVNEVCWAIKGQRCAPPTAPDLQGRLPYCVSCQ